MAGLRVRVLPGPGIPPGVIGGRDAIALRGRLQALGIKHAYFGTEDTLPAADNTLRSLGLSWQQAAAIGDDWPDLAIMQRCAMACAPPDAHPEVKALAHYLTSARAGEGAAREFCDLLLVATGKYRAMLEEYTR